MLHTQETFIEFPKLQALAVVLWQVAMETGSFWMAIGVIESQKSLRGLLMCRALLIISFRAPMLPSTYNLSTGIKTLALQISRF